MKKKSESEAMLIELSGQMVERFNLLKEHYGETESTEVVRRLIYEAYDKLEGHGKKILIAPYVYLRLETRAKEQDLSVDEYVDKIISDHTEMSKYTQGYIAGKIDSKA